MDMSDSKEKQQMHLSMYVSRFVCMKVLINGWMDRWVGGWINEGSFFAEYAALTSRIDVTQAIHVEEVLEGCSWFRRIYGESNADQTASTKSQESEEQ